MKNLTSYALLFIILMNGKLFSQLPNPLNFNTATNATNTGTLALFAADLHWSAALTNSIGPFVPTIVCGNQAVCCWANPGVANANWITYPHNCSASPAEHSCDGNIDVFYRLTLNLPAIICNSVSVSTPSAYCLSMNYYADNCVWAIYVNGVPSYTSNLINPFGALGFVSPVTVNLCNNWQVGTNTVLVHVKSGAPSFPGWEGFLATVNTNSTTIAQPGTVSVQQSNVTCFGNSNGSATVTPVGGIGVYSYSWAPTGGTQPVANNLSAGIYTFFVSLPGSCPFSSVVAISQPSSALSLSVSPPTATACAGATISLTANAFGGTPGYSYSWAGGPLTPNYFISQAAPGTSINSVTAIDANGCTTNQTISTSFLANPVLSFSGNSIICLGDVTGIVVNGASTYTWNNGTTNASISVSPTINTVYTVTGTAINSCTNTQSVSIVVNPLPTVTIVSPTTICAGQTATLTANGASTYSWSNNALTPVTLVSPAFTSNYSVVGTDTNSCSSTATLTLIVNPLPTLTVVSSKTLICRGEKPVTLIANGATSYTWSTGVQTSSLLVSPAVTSNYTVSGTLGGCNSSTIVSVSVKDCVGLFSYAKTIDLTVFPNPFKEKISVTNIVPGSEVQLFDMMGQIVIKIVTSFETAEIDGSDLPRGVYFIKYTHGHDQTVKKLVKE